MTAEETARMADLIERNALLSGTLLRKSEERTDKLIELQMKLRKLEDQHCYCMNELKKAEAMKKQAVELLRDILDCLDPMSEQHEAAKKWLKDAGS